MSSRHLHGRTSRPKGKKAVRRWVTPETTNRQPTAKSEPPPESPQSDEQLDVG
jgi:hypothetical protein